MLVVSIPSGLKPFFQLLLAKVIQLEIVWLKAQNEMLPRLETAVVRAILCGADHPSHQTLSSRLPGKGPTYWWGTASLSRTGRGSVPGAASRHLLLEPRHRRGFVGSFRYTRKDRRLVAFFIEFFEAECVWPYRASAREDGEVGRCEDSGAVPRKDGLDVASFWRRQSRSCPSAPRPKKIRHYH